MNAVTAAATAAACLVEAAGRTEKINMCSVNPLAPNSSKLCCTARDPHPGVLYLRAKQPVNTEGPKSECGGLKCCLALPQLGDSLSV